MSEVRRDEAPAVGPVSGPRARRNRRRRYLTVAILLFLLLVASPWMYNRLSEALAKRWDATQPRDDSGVLSGAEPIEVGPEDAKVGVLLVHGHIGASTNFGELPNRLAEAGYRVHAIQLPGHGTSPYDLIGMTPDDLLLAVLGELRNLKSRHEHVFIVGHSMGGALSTLAAATEEVDGLVLAAPYFRVTHQWYYILRPERWTALTAWALKWAYKGDTFVRVKRREVKDEIVSYRWVPSVAIQRADHLAARARDPEVLGQVLCPLLLLHGPDDFAASPQAAERAFEHFGSIDKRLVWFENSDHHLFWDYDRDEVIGAVVKFIEAHSET